MRSLGLGVHNIPMMGGGSAFDITTIAGLQVWAKNGAENVSTAFPFTWNDSSGNGNHLTQNVSTISNLLLTSAWNETEGSIDMAGASPSGPRFLDYPTQNLSTATLFFAVKMNLSAAFDYYGLTQDKNNSGTNYTQLFAKDTQFFHYLVGGAGSSGTGAISATTNLPNNDEYFVYIVRKDAASGATVNFQNSSDIMATTTNYSGADAITLNTLGFSANADRGLNGKIREFAMYNTSLTDEEIALVVGDIKSRNGIS